MASNGWHEWSKHVLKELERLSDSCERMEAQLSALKGDIVMLKVKSGMWGLVAGAIPTAIMLAIKYL
jgi:hypothetical protein